MRSRVIGAVLILILLLSGAARSRGQAGSGDLTGEVRDSSGGLVSGAKMTLTRKDTGEGHQTLTTGGGVYSFAGLKPGRYSVSAEAAGFRKLLRDGIVVTTGNTARVDFQLEVGQVSEVVRVEGDASPLKTESATLGQTIDVKEI